MLKKLTLLLGICLSVGPLAVIHAYAATGNDHQQKSASKAEQKVVKLGVDTPVIVRLDDGRKLSGRIGEIGKDSFVLLAPVKGDRTARQTNRMVISYYEIKQVKYDGPGGGANLGPAFLIAGAVILIIALVR